jgi:PAS domain S-box-containing protein
MNTPALVSILVLAAFSAILFTVCSYQREHLRRKKELTEKLFQQKEQYRRIVENASSIIILWDIEGNYTFLNTYAENFFGYRHQDLVGKPVIGNTVPRRDSKGKALDAMIKDIIVHPEKYAQNVNEVITKDRKRYWMQWSNKPFFDEDGNIKEFLSIGIDITEKMRAEQQIEASLREKEILLKEIHHRVKNNLQIVSSLLNLQSLSVPDKEVSKFFTASRNRIHSMSLVHEKLYQSENLSRIDFKEYIKDLTMYLFDSYDVDTEKIRPVFSLQKVTYSVDIAIPCALIVHELVSNALQHAFPENRKGTITISLKEDAGISNLTIQDDGIGISQATEQDNDKVLGIQLVNMLSDQLNGSITVQRSGGTLYSFVFRNDEN